MFKRNKELLLVIIIKIIMVILFRIALTEGMPTMYYILQRKWTFGLFCIIAFVCGRQAKYFSCIFSILGALIFNPFYKATFDGPKWDILEWALTWLILAWIFNDLYRHFTIVHKGRQILSDLVKNTKSGRYEVADSTTLYKIDSSIVSKLKSYLRKNDNASISNWYESLSDENKMKIKKIAKLDISAK